MANLNKNKMLLAVDNLVDNLKTTEELVVFIPDHHEISEKENMHNEYELLGYFVTKHPLDNFKSRIKQLDKINDLKEEVEGRSVHVGGIVSKYQQIKTKAGKDMAFLVLEDTTGRLEVVVFSNLFNKNRALLDQNALIEVKGKLEIEEKEVNEETIRVPKIIASFIYPLESTKKIKEVHLKITNRDDIKAIKNVVGLRSGDIKVFIDYENFLLETSYQIPQTTDLLNELRSLCLIKEIEE
ncbi:MAG: OB-fold nucleic acid binding domain-containing protein [Lachnospiraceae bacterium]|nr:OB-fold nucleic acid binding domain-containing protein [Lachnospiraceae bacterium]